MCVILCVDLMQPSRVCHQPLAKQFWLGTQWTDLERMPHSLRPSMPKMEAFQHGVRTCWNYGELWRATRSRIRRPEASLDAWPFRLQTPRVSSQTIQFQSSSNQSNLLPFPKLHKFDMRDLWNFVWHSLRVPTESPLWLCKQVDVDQKNKGAFSRKRLQYNELQWISSPFPLATCWCAEGLLLWVSKEHPKPNYVWRRQYEHANTHTDKLRHSFD